MAASIEKSQEYLPNPSALEGQAIKVSVDPKGEWIVYANGRNIIIRNLENPNIGSIYKGHKVATTAAAFSPSGYYIASGDVQGNLKIWGFNAAEVGTKGHEYITKTETRALSGAIREISWDGESKRVVAVGEGRDKFGVAIMFDTANSVGEITGHMKAISGSSIRPVRPYRVVTCSEDMTVVLHAGPPFKFNRSIKEHNNHVRDVKYSPDGKYFVSVGSDRKIVLHEGSTGDTVKQVDGNGAEGHTASIYGVAWSPDSKKIMTVSGDKTVKIWDVENNELKRTIRLENGQLGCCWTQNRMVSVSSSGDIAILSEENELKTVKQIRGHQKPITSMVVERGAGREIGVYTASYDGKIYHRDIGRDNEVEEISRGDQKDSSSQINCMAIIAGSQSGEKQQSGGLALGAQDDSVYIVRGDKISKIHTEAPAVRLACKGPDTLVGVLTNGTVVDIDVRTETVKVSEGTEGAEATSVAATVRSTDAMVAVAVGYRNGTVRIIKDGAVVELQAVHTREVTQVAFSRCGKLIASGDAAGRINVSDAQTGAPVVAGRWSSHTAAIRALAWASDGQTLVSGALDSHVYVWRVDRAFGAVASELQMHPGGVVGIECIDDRIDGDEKMMIVSAGSDSIVTKSFI